MLNNEIMNIHDIAKYLKVDIRTIYSMVKKNKMPYFRIGNRLRFKKDIIDEWIKNFKE